MSDEEYIEEFKKRCKESDYLALYGAGAVGRMVSEFLHESEIQIDSFAVTKESDEKSFCDIPVKCIDDLPKDALIVLTVSKKFAPSMKEYALSKFENVYYEPELLYQIFLLKCKKASDKVRIENNKITLIDGIKLSEEYFYIVCPASIGDTLYVASMVADYKKYIDYDKICLIVKKHHEDVARCFGSSDDILVSDYVVDLLDMFTIYSQCFRFQNYLYGHFTKNRRLDSDPRYYSNKGNIIERYKKLVFGIDDRNCFDFPKQDVLRDFCKPARNTDDTGVNFVIIMPYAKTAPMLNRDFWRAIVLKLTERGLKVYTNVAGKKELPIEGTEPLNGTIVETVKFCCSAQAVISIRSGMNDVLGFTDSTQIVLNTSEEMSIKWDLTKIWKGKGIINIDTTDKTEDEIVKLVMESI